MTILGLTVPEGQRLWFWENGGEIGTLLMAANYDEAYAKAIAARLGTDEATPTHVEAQQRWFAKNDVLREVEAEYTGPAFAGELPDLDADE